VGPWIVYGASEGPASGGAAPDDGAALDDAPLDGPLAELLDDDA
jgi:hypothetical protein